MITPTIYSLLDLGNGDSVFAVKMIEEEGSFEYAATVEMSATPGREPVFQILGGRRIDKLCKFEHLREPNGAIPGSQSTYADVVVCLLQTLATNYA